MRAEVLIVLSVLSLCQLIHSQQIENVDKDWWKTAVFYQVYPRSFKDSNNDGIGDLKGITSKLNHLKDAGITAVWLSPIYKSPNVDAGYDISDFRAVHPDYGTMEDFEELVENANQLGIQVVMDLVPNHSSDEHEWFEKSANRVPGYENYYVWFDGKENNTKPPNNWVSYFHGPAWHFNEARGQWYLHQFARQQPDLNFRDARVVQEMKDILTFWLNKGVAGFRVDTIPSLFERGDFPDEPLSNDPNSTPDDYGFLVHPYTNDQPETYDMVYQWRKLLDEYPSSFERVMMTESYSEVHKVMGYYGNGTVNGAHFTFNFLFITELSGSSKAEDIVMAIQKWMIYMPSGHVANWVLGNHDQHRVATRYGVERVDGLNMLQMLLPGVKVVYNGEEIGMEDGEVTYEEGQDPQGCNAGPDRYQSFTRDPERTPFQWDNSTNAGFNDGAKTWLPVSEKYKQNNLQLQRAEGVESHYHVFQKVLALRSHPTLVNGDLTVKAFNSQVLMLKRELESSDTFIFVVNISDKEETVNLQLLGRIPNVLSVEVASTGYGNRVGSHENSNNIILRPYEALILKPVENV